MHRVRRTLRGTSPAAPLRVLLLAGLVAAAAFLLEGDGGEEPGALLVGDGDEGRLTAALVSHRPPGAVRWTDPSGPGGRAAWILSPGPAVPPLALPVGEPRRLRVRPPVRPTAGRPSALSASVAGAPGDTVRVRWRDALGEADSLLALVDSGGRADVGLRVRPAREGWHAWTVAADGDSAEVGAWVRPARPVRILALVLAPGWEARFALRALDEAGVDVDAQFELGRVDVGAQGAGAPAGWASDAYDPDAWDVVLLLGEGAGSAAGRDALAAFARRGGGVLVAPPADGPGAGSADARRASPLLAALGLADSLAAGPALAVGEAPRWSLPAELSPLPPAPSRAATLVLAGTEAARVVARGADGEALAVARALGRGRVAVLGLAESWRWRMEGGDVEAHRAWWRGWAEWAASGAREPVVATVPDEPVPVGAVVRVGLEALDADRTVPSSLRLERPDGDVETLAVAAAPGGAREARFLARSAGPHRLTWDGGETGVLAQETGGASSAPDPAARSLLATASGGRPLPPAPGEDAAAAGGTAATPGTARDAGDEAFPGEAPWRPAGGSPLPLALGALLGLLALAEWMLRRLRGGP